MKPTKEQEDILEASKSEKNLKVVARAGTGKSSTIRMLSEIHQEKSLYLVFNKSLATEATAKFGDHVDCRTMHSLAYREAALPLKHKLKGSYRDHTYVNRLRTMTELVSGLNIKDYKGIGKNKVASFLLTAMRRWEYSAAFEITASILPKDDIKKAADDCDVQYSLVEKYTLSLLKKWWKYRTDYKHPAEVAHNTYVKMWQLTKPVLDYKIIYLDEAQDLFNVFYDIIHRQDHCKIIVVGDDKQAIYQWNGAVNALDKFKYTTLPLTQSFRYGQSVADIAVKVFPEDVKLTGNPLVESSIASVDKNKPYTAIYRTNGKLIEDATESVSEGWNVNIEIDVTAFKNKLQAVSDFIKGKKVKHPEVAVYSDVKEMTSEAEEDPELKRLLRMCFNKKDGYVLNILDKHKNSRKPHITFCTAHKSKGREWSQVLLADDFPKPEKGDELSIPEQNLLYVAATRAIDVLQPNKTLLQLESMR